MADIVKHRVVVSRHWHNPEITAALHLERKGVPGGMIALDMSVKDFVAAMVHELGSKRWAMKQEDFAFRLQACASIVLDKMKDSSAHAGTANDDRKFVGE
jgi:hypothetical protein